MATSFDPNERISLRMRSELDTLLEQLGERPETRSQIIVHAILTMVSNRQDPTIAEVITYAEENYAPPRGWRNFNRAAWEERVPAIVKALKSGKPHKALEL